jgi:hypothetical protein
MAWVDLGGAAGRNDARAPKALIQGTADCCEFCLNVQSVIGQGANDHNANQSGDQPIFDGRGTGAASQKTSQELLHDEGSSLTYGPL